VYLVLTVVAWGCISSPYSTFPSAAFEQIRVSYLTRALEQVSN